MTAFIYSGLGARPFWLTAILAPRFLASAFASGPALLILLSILLRRLTRFDPGEEPIRKLAVIVAYGMLLNVFFLLLEIFTAFYSNLPEHMLHWQYMFGGIGEQAALVPWMWTSVTMAAAALVLLLVPRWRNDLRILPLACILVFLAIWIDKGLGMVVAGFVPSVLGGVTEYAPTLLEITISLAVYAMGLLILTFLFRIALSVRKQV